MKQIIPILLVAICLILYFQQSEWHVPEKVINSRGMVFLKVKAGSFQMGSPGKQKYHRKDEKLHEVQITRDFYLQTTEITQKQWHSITGESPSNSGRCENCPVDSISRSKINDVIQELNQREGCNLSLEEIWKEYKTDGPLDRSSGCYRLPTEAEWEYACKAGTSTIWPHGDQKTDLSDYAWYSVNSQNVAKSVAKLKANPWGFYDMLGNRWEAVEDYYISDYHKKTSSINPVYQKSTNRLIKKGGYSRSHDDQVRCSHRGHMLERGGELETIRLARNL